MLYYFPQPYQDEILYSLIARYNTHISSNGSKESNLLLFDHAAISSTLDFPSGIEWLSQELELLWGIEPIDIIERFTLYPLYSKYLTKERNEQILASMLTVSGDIHTRAGLNAGCFPPIQMPRYCPLCVENDLKSGETYFRRSHQIPSVPICVEHNCFLSEVPIYVETINKHLFIPANRVNCPKNQVVFNENDELLILSKELISVLNNDLVSNWNPDQRYFYKEWAKNLSFTKGKDSIYWANLYHEFSVFYKEDTLKAFRSVIDLNNHSCWFKAIFRKHRKVFDPIRHIIVQRFLNNIDVKKKDPEKEIKIWKCLNPICVDFNKNVINRPIRNFDSKAKKEIFYLECHCGYGYTESIMSNTGDLFVRVKNYGPVWENRLKEMVTKGHPVRTIARALGCDSKTVNSFVRPRNPNKIPLKAVSELKQSWLVLKQENPSASITELRKICPSLYTALYRADKTWLFELIYPLKESKTHPKGVDWQERDSQLLSLLKECYHKLLLSKNKRRISKTILFSLSGKKGLLEKNIDKLSECSLYLDSILESEESFRIRRILYARKRILENKESLSESKLLRRAGVRKEYITTKIQALIRQIINNPFSIPKTKSA